MHCSSAQTFAHIRSVAANWRSPLTLVWPHLPNGMMRLENHPIAPLSLHRDTLPARFIRAAFPNQRPLSASATTQVHFLVARTHLSPDLRVNSGSESQRNMRIPLRIVFLPK